MREGCLRVAVRIRPTLASREEETDSCIAVGRAGCSNFRDLAVALPPLPGQVKPAASFARFEFDRVFGPHSTQHDVFEHCGKPVLDAAMNGQRATLFAYVRTGHALTHGYHTDL